MHTDDTNDLEAALAELSAHPATSGDVDPDTSALLAKAEVRDAMEVRREIQEMPDPPAPEAIEVPGDAGAMLIQAEAVVTYVAPVEVALPDAPRMPSGPVRIHPGVDPRRAKTVKVVTRAAADEPTRDEAAANEQGVVEHGAVERRLVDVSSAAVVEPAISSREPSPSLRKKGRARVQAPRRLLPVVLVSSGVFVAVVVAGLALREPKAQDQSGSAMDVATSPSPAIAEMSSGMAGAACAGVGHPPCPTVAAASTAPSPAAGTSAAAAKSAPVVTGSGPTANAKATATEEVYPDAAPPTVTSAPVVTAPPAATGHPSAVPIAPPVGSHSATSVTPLFKLEKE